MDCSPLSTRKWPIFQQGPPIVPQAGREVLQLHVAGANYGCEFSFWGINPSSPIAKQRCMMATVPQACGYVPRGQLEVAAKSPKSKPSSMLLREPKLEIHRNKSKSTSGPLEGHKARPSGCLWRKCSRCSRCLPGTVHEVHRTEIQWQYQQAKH